MAASYLPVILEMCDMNPGSSRPSCLKTSIFLDLHFVFGYPLCFHCMIFCFVTGLCWCTHELSPVNALENGVSTYC
jgi:hypothetical protein